VKLQEMRRIWDTRRWPDLSTGIVATSRLALHWMCDSPERNVHEEQHPHIRGTNKQ